MTTLLNKPQTTHLCKHYCSQLNNLFSCCFRFMWFCFTSIGGVVTLIIIVSLWEKFQTNPTITGLDTDFHNWDVPFPTVSLCANDPVNNTAITEYIDQ